MISSCEDAVNEVKSFLENQSIVTSNEYYPVSEFNGEVDVEISLSIDISYIDNFGNCLELLSRIGCSFLHFRLFLDF